MFWVGSPFPGRKPLEQPWSLNACGTEITGFDTQLEAELEAIIAAFNCDFHDSYDPGTPGVPNTQQICCQPIIGGGTRCYTIAAGRLVQLNQVSADQLAHALACYIGTRSQMNLSDIDPTVCLGKFYAEFITATGTFGTVTFSIAGPSPPGLEFDDLGDGSLSVAGTPDPAGAGSYTFRVTARDSLGTSVAKNYTLNVFGISNITSIPPATLNQAYSFQLTGAGGTAPYVFTAEMLPAGLTISESGLISGTPTSGSGPQPVTFKITDSTGLTGLACSYPTSITVRAVGFQICNWPTVRASLNVGSWPASTNPAWGGIFDRTIMDSFGDTVWYFINQSILGKKCAASDTVDYPNGPWQDQVNPGDCFALLSYNPGTGTWSMTLSQPDCTDGNYYSYSQLFSSNDPNDASGTYGKVVGGGTSPDTIIIEALSQTGCCPPASESMAPVPGVVGAGQPARMRIKNYDQSIFMPGAACVAFPVPPGTPVWDGTMPDKFTDNVTTLVYNDQNLGPPFARDRTIKGCLAVTMQLDYANSGPPYVYWELQIACGDGSVIWFGHKFHGTSPEGTYTLANGVNAPPGSPACLTLESY